MLLPTLRRRHLVLYGLQPAAKKAFAPWGVFYRRMLRPRTRCRPPHGCATSGNRHVTHQTSRASQALRLRWVCPPCPGRGPPPRAREIGFGRRGSEHRPQFGRVSLESFFCAGRRREGGGGAWAGADAVSHPTHGKKKLTVSTPSRRLQSAVDMNTPLLASCRMVVGKCGEA
jgi:hypothetical protein